MSLINENEKMSKLTYSDGFMETFKSMMDKINSSLDKLNDAKKYVSGTNYGICNSCYKIRYITPSDVSTYISSLMKIYESGAFSNRCDVDAITVALVKQFVDDNGCVPFEASTYVDEKYINPTTATLIDLIMSCENDVYAQSTYSAWELSHRVAEDKFIADVKRLNDVHFIATMNRLVDAIPDVIASAKSNIVNIDIAIMNIEQFILFTTTLFAVSIESMLSYAIPEAEFKTASTVVDKPVDDDNVDKAFVESAMVRTNDLTLCERAPFICNMRDVVLQDMTSDFKDTLAALNFIMSDPRSPIAKLIKLNAKYTNDNNMDRVAINTDTIIDLMRGCSSTHTPSIFDAGCARHTMNDLENKYNDVNFNSSVQWLDKIAYGNNYLNGNYRRDQVGNQHVDNILNTLDVVYKLYASHELTTNEELVNNIIAVSGTMKLFITRYVNHPGEFQNVDLIKDVMCVLGEIMTRNMIKLYHNNTRVFSVSDDMNDTMIPGIIYNESFILEADDATAQPKPTVSVGGKDATGASKTILQKGTDMIKKFISWVTTKLATYGQKFNADHKRETEWIKKNDQLNKDIAAAITSKKFIPNINNFPIYDIPAQELGNINVDEVVKKYIDSKEPIDTKKVEAELYPSAISSEISNIASESDQQVALVNYVLFKQTKAKPSYSGALTVQIWNDMISDLTQTGNLIETQCKKTTDKLKQACMTIQNASHSSAAKTADNNDQNTTDDTGSKATQLIDVVQKISRNYYVTTLNVLRSKFYNTTYSVYRDIVKAYQQQSTSANDQSNAQNTTGNKTEVTNNATGQQDADALKPDNNETK